MEQITEVVGQATPEVAVVKPSRAKKAKKEAKVDKKVKVQAKAKGGIGSLITAKILDGKLTNDEILKVVKKTHPTSKTTYACVAWYKSKLRKAGEIE